MRKTKYHLNTWYIYKCIGEKDTIQLIKVLRNTRTIKPIKSIINDDRIEDYRQKMNLIYILSSVNQRLRDRIADELKNSIPPF